jgi:hypothetical protein
MGTYPRDDLLIMENNFAIAKFIRGALLDICRNKALVPSRLHSSIALIPSCNNVSRLLPKGATF